MYILIPVLLEMLQKAPPTLCLAFNSVNGVFWLTVVFHSVQLIRLFLNV